MKSIQSENRPLFSNYRMRLRKIWRILQIKEGVIHRGQRQRWITPSEICRILHILWKPNSIALLFIQHKLFPDLKGVSPFRSLFFSSPKITQPRPQVFSVNSSIICSWLHFWCHQINNTKFFPNLVHSSWFWWIMRVTIRNREIFWMNNKNIYGSYGKPKSA